MNLFAFSSLLVLISNFLLAIFVFIKGKGKKTSFIWGLLCAACIFWGWGGYKFSTTTSKEIAFFWWQIAYICAVLAPVIYYHFIYEYLNLKQKYVLISLYGLSGFFLLFVFFARELFFGDLRLIFNQFYCFDWTKYKSPIFLIFYIGFYWMLLLYAMSLLVRQYKNSVGLRRIQIKYLIFASIIGWVGPHGFLPDVFGFNIYPYSNFLLAIYPVIVTYAILKHHLMDINIVIQKGLIYSVLVGLITAIYLIFVIAIGRIFQSLVGYQSFFVNLFAIFVIAILFNPLRNKIQRFLDRRFFKGTLESLVQEKERLKQELFQAEKLAYVGNLASSVAHEIRNPLTAIKTFMEFLPERLSEPEFKQKFKSLIPKEIERIEGVINQLLDLAKPRKPNLKPVNIMDIIDSTLTLLENNLKSRNINVKKDYQGYEAIIQADTEQLRQVFLNLFLNSIQAMNDGGVLTISTSIGSINSPSLEPSRAKSRDKNRGSSIGQFVTICVKDNGSGITQENLTKLFTPFFTTKKEGVGLGLTVTQEIIKQHKGDIKVKSEVGEWTKFIIELPLIKVS